MAGIGGVAVDTIRGQESVLKQRVELWQVPGVDGYGAQVKGLGDAPFSYRVTRYAALATVKAWAVAISSLQGTIVSIVDGRGDTISNCLVTQVSAPVYSPVIYEGTAQYRGVLTVSGVLTT